MSMPIYPMSALPRTLASVVLLSVMGLTGCDQLGIESPEKIAAARQAEGNAIGGACRHAGRAIEDCYALNKKADKAAVFAGWRDMNDYMRENKIDPVPPQLSGTTPTDRAKSADGESAAAEPAETKSGKAAKAH